MGIDSKIAWTTSTWNPWQGCTRVSEGCAHCYMFRDKKRYGQDPHDIKRSAQRTFNSPRRWKKSENEESRVFVCSWSDFFIPEADAWREEAWQIIRECTQHTYLLLTKRAENIQARLPDDWGTGYKHVWLGITGENQPRFMDRMAILKDIPAVVRFVSAEPLLERLNIEPYADYIDWLIVAGESGGDARQFKQDWAYDLLAQSRKHDIAFFMKQMGSNSWPTHYNHRSGEDPSEWPADLRVREFPREKKILAI